MKPRPKFRLSSCIALTLSVLLILSVPLFVIVYTDRLVGLYLQFPPRELYTEKMPFSFWAFVLVAIVGFAGLYAAAHPLRSLRIKRRAAAKFPLWGYLGIFGVLISWVLAWNRYEWFEPLQIHSFDFLWLFYILTANAFLKYRTGSSLINREPLCFLLLFPFSACFWWLFEFLNRFVQNWYYQAVSQLDENDYFLFASLAFATLLPSVWVTKEIIESYFEQPAQNEILAELSSEECFDNALLGIGLSLLVLFLMPSYPWYLYPFVWIVPVSLFASYSLVLGYMIDGIAIDRLFISRCSYWAFASLICGFFWEMWNYKSLAKWIYHVSYVDAFRVFEMPLLGYFGYLPFGLCCWIGVSFLRFSFKGEFVEED